MLDMNLADEAGLTEIMQKLSWGAARYGERILDQEANGIIKAIVRSDFEESHKKNLLGQFLFDEIHTHEDFGGQSNTTLQAFAKGNETKPYSLSKKASAADLLSAKKLFNTWAKGKGLNTLKLDGTFGQDVVSAFANYNADSSNLRKIAPSGQEIIDASGSTAYLVDKLGLGKMLPDLNIRPLDRIVGYDKAGKAVYSSETDVRQVLDPASGKVRVIGDDYLSEKYPAWETPATTTTVDPAGEVSDDSSEERRKAFNRSSAVRNGISVIEGLAGGLMATTDIPKWGPTQEYQTMKGEVTARRDQGYTAEEQANINQQLNNNYAAGVSAIRSVAGNGGNQGSVLAALGSLNNNLQSSYLQTAASGAALARNNYSRYQNMVMADLDLDRQIFQQDLNNAMETKQNGLAMVQDASQKIFEEQMYRDSYGPDSMYNEYLESRINKEKNYAQIQELQSQAFLNYLRGNQPVQAPVVPRTSVQTSTGANPLQQTFANRRITIPQ